MSLLFYTDFLLIILTSGDVKAFLLRQSSGRPGSSAGDVIGLGLVTAQSPSARPPTGDACLGRAV